MNKQKQLERILEMQLSTEQLKAIETEWKAFYEEPELYKNGIVVDCVKRFLEE